MNRSTPAMQTVYSPSRSSLIDSLARLILMHEHLTPDELPRCRREVLLQLRASRAFPARAEAHFPRVPAATSQR